MDKSHYKKTKLDTGKEKTFNFFENEENKENKDSFKATKASNIPRVKNKTESTASFTVEETSTNWALHVEEELEAENEKSKAIQKGKKKHVRQKAINNIMLRKAKNTCRTSQTTTTKCTGLMKTKKYTKMRA